MRKAKRVKSENREQITLSVKRKAKRVKSGNREQIEAEDRKSVVFGIWCLFSVELGIGSEEFRL